MKGSPAPLPPLYKFVDDIHLGINEAYQESNLQLLQTGVKGSPVFFRCTTPLGAVHHHIGDILFTLHHFLVKWHNMWRRLELIFMPNILFGAIVALVGVGLSFLK